MSKEKELKVFQDKVDKLYGKGLVKKLTAEPENIERFSTGSLRLDNLLGGGFPRGRIIEIYGHESSSKTTLCIHAMAAIHAGDPEAMCAIVDAEHAFDRGYAEALGVDVDRLYIAQPDYGEQGLDIAENMVTSGLFSLVVIDSVSALTPKAEIEGDYGDSKMGLQARMMSQACRKLTGLVNKHDCSVIFINQIRMKIGVMFGNPETTSGGNALKFYASVRIEMRKSTLLKDGTESTGNLVKAKVIKSKISSPACVAEFSVYFGKGISKVGEILDEAVDAEIIQKAGSWFSYNGTKLGQGRDKVITMLEDNPELTAEVEKLVIDSWNKDKNPKEPVTP